MRFKMLVLIRFPDFVSRKDDLVDLSTNLQIPFAISILQCMFFRMNIRFDTSESAIEYMLCDYLRSCMIHLKLFYVLKDILLIFEGQIKFARDKSQQFNYYYDLKNFIRS